MLSAVKEDPRYVPAHQALAEYYQRTGQPARAICLEAGAEDGVEAQTSADRLHVQLRRRRHDHQFVPRCRVPLDPFGRALQYSLDRVLSLGDDAAREFDWNEVPRFPVGTADD